MIFKSAVKNYKKEKEHLVNELLSAPGVMLDSVAKTDWNTDSDQPYLKVVLPFLQEHTKKLMKKIYKKDVKMVNGIIHNVWFQVYIEASNHNWHTHANAQFANVFYIELEDSKFGTKFLNEKNVDVKEGEILSFPSWWLHRSPKIKSNSRKIVVAYNLSFENV